MLDLPGFGGLGTLGSRGCTFNESSWYAAGSSAPAGGDPEIIVPFHADLGRTGLGDASVRKVLAPLQGVLQRAVEWQRIPANPCKAVRKPSQRRDRVVRPLAPEQVERPRRHLLARGRLRDAVFISVLAYAGLRPGEALALTWGSSIAHSESRGRSGRSLLLVQGGPSKAAVALWSLDA
jgi:site-specific recombinase XerC